jgi:hypothetical protein
VRPRLLLLIAAAALAAVHVVGVMFARPLHRPAEVLAVLCLLGYAIRYDLLPGRGSTVPDGSAPAGRWAVWGLSGAVAVLLAGAALTVPPAPGGVGEWQFLSPEEYSGLITRAQLTSLIPGTAALLFVLALLIVLRHRPGARARGVDRLLLGTGIAAAVLVVGWVAVRIVVLEVVAGLEVDDGPGEGMPTLGVAGATIGSATPPYAVRDHAMVLSLDVIPATAAMPQPTPALIAALQLAAAVLIVAGLSQPRSNP